jgi:hypothetical protein
VLVSRWASASASAQLLKLATIGTVPPGVGSGVTLKGLLIMTMNDTRRLELQASQAKGPSPMIAAVPIPRSWGRGDHRRFHGTAHARAATCRASTSPARLRRLPVFPRGPGRRVACVADAAGTTRRRPSARSGFPTERRGAVNFRTPLHKLLSVCRSECRGPRTSRLSGFLCATGRSDLCSCARGRGGDG